MNNNQDMYNNQNMYNQNMYDQNMYTPEAEVAPAKKTMAIWSLIMGILSVTVCCGGWLPSILAVVFANISVKNNEDGQGMAKAGKIMGIIGIVLSVIAIIGSVIYVVFVVGIAGMASMGSGYYY